jgi:N-acyl-D-amino-acid deacylase
VYFIVSEENLLRQLSLPWVSVCSDEEALAPRGVFLARHPHPRAYGAFARFLGHYVRDGKVATLGEAVRRLTSLPAGNFRLADRGRVATGSFGDLVIFDPAAIRDHSTYDDPQRFASGVTHVFVNGEIVLRDGELTGARPGRFVRGPGWKAAGGQSGTAVPKAAG